MLDRVCLHDVLPVAILVASQSAERGFGSQSLSREKETLSIAVETLRGLTKNGSVPDLQRLSGHASVLFVDEHSEL